MHRFRSISAALAVFCAVAFTRQASGQSDEAIARSVTIAQANTEYGLRVGRHPKLYTDVDFAVELLSVHNDSRLYRVLVQSAENRHPYTVALVGDRLLRLGGFAAPALLSADRLSRDLGLPVDPRLRAYALARLGDRNGAQEFVGPETPNDSAGVSLVRRRWSEIVDSTWPGDTTVVDVNGAYYVTFTVFSRAVQDHADGWDPILYRMSFDESGALRGWASRTGRRFSALRANQ